MKEHFVFLCCILLLASACRKKELPDLQENPIQFFVKGKLNNQDIYWAAGLSNQYMHTRFIKDSNAVYSYEGYLSESPCEVASSCSPAIHFKIREKSKNTNAVSDLLIPGIFKYRSPADSIIAGYTLHFKSKPIGTATNYTYLWEFPDGSTSTEANPQKTFFPPYPSNSQVCLTITESPGNQSSTLCYPVTIQQACTANFSYFISGSNLVLNALEKGLSPFTYLWDFGNGFSPLNQQTSISLVGIDTAKVCLKILDANGCEAVSCKNVITDSNSTLLRVVSNFEYENTAYRILNDFDYERVAIHYTDENAKTWKSDKYNQPFVYNFELLKAHTHTPNRKGEATHKLELRFNCRLYGESPSDYIDLIDAEAVIALAHP
jgi:hypothetical protein